MQRERFEQLVARLEGLAAASPGRYRLRVAGLAALGFGYVFGVLAIALSLLAAMAWAYTQGTGRTALRKAGIAVGSVVYAIGRAMWVRFERPEGLEIRRDQAPALFDAIDETRRAMRAPRVHRVLLEDTLGASVIQHPRLGVLGWQENVLRLGLPLLQSLDEAQLRGVLAHEFGHLAGAHSRFGGWIQRVDATWQRLLERLEAEDHWSTFVFRPFFRWYAPYFDAYTFVLRRANELEADRDAAEITSARALGDALVSLHLKDTDLQHRLWPHVQSLASERPEPDVAPFTRMARRLARGPNPQDAEHWLPQLLALSTTSADTHPCLTDRLQALGVPARVPPAVETSAADALLGPSHAALAGMLDERWRSWIETRWRHHYASVNKDRERLAALDAEAQRRDLEPDAAWERAWLTERCGNPEAALALYTAFADRHPDHASGQFAAGRTLLAQGDEAGIAYLERAMEITDDGIVAGCELIDEFLRERGEEAKAEAWAERGAAHQRHLDAVAEERGSVRYGATYLTHSVPAQQLDELVEALAALGEVKRAWLVRMHLELSDEPLHVLGIERRQYTWNPASWIQDPEAADIALQERVLAEVPLPGECFVLVLNHRGRRDRAIFEDTAGSEIGAGSPPRRTD